MYTVQSLCWVLALSAEIFMTERKRGRNKYREREEEEKERGKERKRRGEKGRAENSGIGSCGLGTQTTCGLGLFSDHMWKSTQPEQCRTATFCSHQMSIWYWQGYTNSYITAENHPGLNRTAACAYAKAQTLQMQSTARTNLCEGMVQSTLPVLFTTILHYAISTSRHRG